MQEYPKGRKRVKKFFVRNGIYLVLAFSLLTVTAVIIAGVTERLSKTDEKDSLNAQQQVEQKVTGQSDTRTTSTTSTIAQPLRCIRFALLGKRFHGCFYPQPS